MESSNPDNLTKGTLLSRGRVYTKLCKISDVFSKTTDKIVAGSNEGPGQADFMFYINVTNSENG